MNTETGFLFCNTPPDITGLKEIPPKETFFVSNGGQNS